MTTHHVDIVLFEGEIRGLTGDSEGIVIRGNKVLRTSHYHDLLHGRRVLVVAADPAPTCNCEDTETGRWFEDCPVHDAADPAPTGDDDGS